MGNREGEVWRTFYSFVGLSIWRRYALGGSIFTSEKVWEGGVDSVHHGRNFYSVRELFIESEEDCFRHEFRAAFYREPFSIGYILIS